MVARPYKAAIVGLGNIAWKYGNRVTAANCGALTHAGAYQTRSDVELVGGCSPHREDREAFAVYYGLPTFDSAEKLLKETSPDIVSICSPSEFHYQHTLQCLEADIPMIWLEKPPTTELTDCQTLIEKQRRSTSTVLINYQRRYCHCYNRLKELYVKHTLGKLLFVHLTYSCGLSLNGSHIIDSLFFILGDDVQLSSEYVSKSSSRENPSFILRDSNGLQIHVTGLSVPYHCIDISLTFTQGRASVLHGGMETRLETKVEHELFPGFYRLKGEQTHLLGSGGIDEAMSEALDDLIISHRQRKEPRSNLTTAGNTLAIINGVNQALEVPNEHPCSSW